MRARRIAAVAACTAVAASLCVMPASAQDDPSVLAERTLATKLDIPWDIEFLPDGSGIFTERDTRKIKKISGTTVTELDTVEQAQTTGGEGGLLGLAVSKSFATDNSVFIYYSTASDNRVAKLQLGGTPQPIVTGIPKNRYHNGGGLEWGPDGFLWATTGDGQNTANAQNWNSLGGKVLRFDTAGKPATGNPRAGSVVYSIGHRNVQGITWIGVSARPASFSTACTTSVPSPVTWPFSVMLYGGSSSVTMRSDCAATSRGSIPSRQQARRREEDGTDMRWEFGRSDDCLSTRPVRDLSGAA
jgi:glucose/arabinose dehydrogenase